MDVGISQLDYVVPIRLQQIAATVSALSAADIEMLNHLVFPPPFISQAPSQICLHGQNAHAMRVHRPLSAREGEVVSAIVGGQKGQSLAETLGCSYSTVKTIRRRAMAKLGAANTADLVRIAIQVGISGRAMPMAPNTNK